MSVIPNTRYNYPLGYIVDITDTNDNVLTFTYDDTDSTEMEVAKCQIAVVTPYQTGSGVVSPFVKLDIFNNTPLMVRVSDVSVALGVTTAQDLADLIVTYLASYTGGVSQASAGTQGAGQIPYWTANALELSKGGSEVTITDNTTLNARIVNAEQEFQFAGETFGSQLRVDQNLQLGNGAVAQELSSTAVGINADASYSYGTCVGAQASGAGLGTVSVGAQSQAHTSGVAVGYTAHADVGGVAIGKNAIADTDGIAIGLDAVAVSYEFAITDNITNIKWRGISYVLPSSNAAGVLTNDGSGNLSWA